MPDLGLETHIVDRATHDATVRRFREQNILLPTFGQLADPDTIPDAVRGALDGVDPSQPHPLNLFRVHWFNDTAGTRVSVPDHLVLPPSLTGVEAPIVLALGNRFPMIRAHKVLAAYGCLAPRVVTGQFDPSHHRAVWPSTGNYCRGGVAISRIMDCRGVAVLPEGMSRERFRWLEEWVAAPEDIIRTPGTESNVKEIYDRCAELDRDPDTIIFNQFAEFGNHLVHRLCTGQALERLHAHLSDRHPRLRMGAYVSATGSAGTLAAGDHLKTELGARIVAVEALECPTLLYNGFGEHNIQGIGDKHVPYIHNVMNTDCVTAVSDRSTDALDLLFNSDVGRSYLVDHAGIPPNSVAALTNLGYSGICNVLAAIKTARWFGFGPDEAVYTVATDDAAMYDAERETWRAEHHAAGYETVDAARAFGEHLAGVRTDHYLEMSHRDRERILNLGYFTWVEQQGIPVETFVRRRDPDFWRGLTELPAAWDELIHAFNRETGVTV